MKTAILVDGAFYLNRSRKIFGSLTPQQAAKKLFMYCQAHINYSKQDDPDCTLYRIYYYDCPPANLQAIHPITQELIQYNATPQAMWRTQFFEELKKGRKVSIRLGSIDEKNPTWVLRGRRLTDLIDGQIYVEDLEPEDLRLDIRQKGVDMQIGLDISAMAFKKQVDQMVLIAGDSDFVPAAKLARREGVDFILDPMWLPIKADLFEHIDGLRSMVGKPDEYGNFDGYINF